MSLKVTNQEVLMKIIGGIQFNWHFKPALSQSQRETSVTYIHTNKHYLSMIGSSVKAGFMMGMVRQYILYIYIHR